MLIVEFAIFTEAKKRSARIPPDMAFAIFHIFREDSGQYRISPGKN